MRLIVTTTLLVLLSLQSLLGQTGREFWFVAPEITSAHGDTPLLFRITTQNDAANITFSMPANSDFNPKNIILQANTQESIEINPIIIENKPSNRVNNKGICITSDADITIYYEVANHVNPEKFSLKGSKALGEEFFVPSQNLYRNYPYTPIACEKADIVATDNNTSITITPTVNVTGHYANVPYTISLDQGQTYSIEYTGTDYRQSMAGTQISADKPIAVTISDDSVNEPGVRPQDLIGDQLIPISALGTEYIAVKAYGQREAYCSHDGVTKYVSPVNKLFILAIEDGTILYVDNDPNKPVLMNKGELINLDIVNSALYIHSNKPVYAYQLAGIPNSNGNELGSAILPPNRCNGSRKVSFTRTFIKRFYIQLITQGRNQNSFILRDQHNMVLNHLDGITWEYVPGTNQGDPDKAWYSVSMPLDISTGMPYSIENTTGLFHMSVLDENAGSASFAYLSSMSNGPIIDGPTKACSGDAIVLQTKELHTNYKWYSEFSSNQILSEDPSISVTKSGKYWVTTETELSGCEQTDAVEVEFIRPEFDLGPDQKVCPGEAVEISLPTGLGTYTWFDGSSSYANSLVLHPGEAKDVWVKVKDNSELGCTSVDRVHLEAYDIPVWVFPSIYENICSGDQIHCDNWWFMRYQWAINGIEQEGETGPSIVATIPGEYSLTAQGLNGCYSTNSIDVKINPLPVFDLGPDITTSNPKVTLDGPSGYMGYDWSNGSTTPIIVVNTSGDYSLTVTDEQGCRGMDLIHVAFDQATHIPETNQVPFILYPNPSHGNVFIDFNAGITIQNIQVFNSKGELNPVQITTKAKKIVMKGLKQGLNYVIVETNTGNFNSKIIIK
ncbi:MAG: T9SS type A sorting domain-containing protein [Marinilabiliaceae bacterium]|nr:T9SS type A sorting domain-containing protein [Marinilabiliaceae bacterium]